MRGERVGSIFHDISHVKEGPNVTVTIRHRKKLHTFPLSLFASSF
jgi:membrane-bound metal-dependent hydrolase YbcI (DUF457 family)